MIAQARRLFPILVVFLVGGPGAVAWAAEPPPPVLDDHEGATRLRPPMGSLNGALAPAPAIAAPSEPDAPALPAEDRWGLSAHGRVITLPAFILDAFWQDNPGYTGASAGLSFEYGDPHDALWVVQLDWTSAVFPNYNWREVGVPAGASTYAEIRLHFISVDVTYRGASHLAGPLWFAYGGGLGIGGLVGDLHTAEVLPTCTEPIQSCGTWRDVTHKTPELPTDVWPVLHLTTGLMLDLGSSGLMRLELGFRDAFYLGLSAGFLL
jgi:hypothetical protein